MNSLTVVDSQQSAAEMSHYILLLLCFIILPITGFPFENGALKKYALWHFVISAFSSEKYQNRLSLKNVPVFVHNYPFLNFNLPNLLIHLQNFLIHFPLLRK